MKDTDLMPWGKYKDKRMIDVPDDYLIWIYKENREAYENGHLISNYTKPVLDYIVDSFESECLK